MSITYKGKVKTMEYKGFSLIELVVAMAIFSILAVIAVPSYTGYVDKSRRSDGKAALMELQLKMEKQRGSCATYASAIDVADNCATGKIKVPATSVDGHYNISIVSASSTGNSFKILADPTGVQTRDSGCDPLSITVNNVNPKGLREPANCW